MLRYSVFAAALILVGSMASASAAQINSQGKLFDGSLHRIGGRAARASNLWTVYVDRYYRASLLFRACDANRLGGKLLDGSLQGGGIVPQCRHMVSLPSFVRCGSGHPGEELFSE